MKTKLTELLHITYPIIQGAMAWTSEHKLAAAVANAGATGVIASGGRDADWVRNEIRTCRALTDKPFGVNLMLMADNIDELMAVIQEEKPAFVTLGAGNPVPHIAPLHEAGIKVIPVVPNFKLAKRVASAGADAIIIEGQEAGGHIGTQSTMPLMENVLPEIDIPVIVAGGIVDGRGLAAALVMGASGVQMGSRFILADECQMHTNCKEAIIKATDTDSVITGLISHGNGGVRSLKNAFTDRYIAAEHANAPKEELTTMSKGTNKLAAVNGDIVNGVVQCDQSLNRLTKMEPAKVIVDSIIKEAIDSLKKAQAFTL
ncbi:MAG: nitronate monooxygenase [Veillonellaceae bacterium]|nr:nitronate monooxygenase [Veillonellaceae bacterium]